jgi:cytochrome c oxidase subunit II
MSRLCRFVMIVLCGVSCTPKSAESPVEEISPPASQTGNIDNGKVLYNTCRACHGDSGEGDASLHSPAVANLDPWYAYRQLKNFSQGIRGYLPQDTTGNQMAAIARSLKDSTAMLDVVAYIETLSDANVVAATEGDTKKGERTYQTICGSCHGPGAKGNEAMHAPRLNGVQSWYLKSQILKFQTSLRGAHPNDIHGAPMVPMMALLKDEQAVDDIIAYIQSTVRTLPK